MITEKGGDERKILRAKYKETKEKKERSTFLKKERRSFF